MKKALVAALLLALPSLSAADEYHYNDIFMGARATGMAGTMIGLADEPSAAYYNPAGLAHARHDMVSLSGTALVGRTLTFKDFLGQNLNLDSTSAFSPSAVTTSPLGSGRLAFSGLTPSQEAFRVNQVFTAESLPADSGLAEVRMGRERSDATYLVGFSYGQDVGRDLDLGVAGFYVYRTYREHRSDYRELSRPDPSRPDLPHAWQSSYDEQGISHGVLIILGLLYHPGGQDGRFRLGVAAQMPVNVSTKAVAEQETFIADWATGTQDLVFKRQPALNNSQIESRVPPMLGAGMSLKILRSWLVAADATFHGYDSTQLMGRLVEKNQVLNGSLATEVHLTKDLWIRAGAFTNFTSAPHHSPTDASAALQADSWDQYGGTVGLSYNDDVHHSFAIAAKYAVMKGDASVSESPTLTRILQVDGRELSVVFGGSYFF